MQKIIPLTLILTAVLFAGGQVKKIDIKLEAEKKTDQVADSKKNENALIKSDEKKDSSTPVLFNSSFPDIAKIVARKKLIVAMYNKDVPPFYFKDKNEKMIGVDVELAKIIANKISPDLEVEFLRTAETYDAIIEQVQKGEADIAISKLSYTSDRGKKIVYSDKPYVTLNVTMLLDRQIIPYQTLSALFGKGLPHNFCVIKKSSYVKIAEELFPGVGIVEADNPDHLTKLLTEERKCSAILRDNNEIKKILLKAPKLNLRFKPISIKGKYDPIFIAIDPTKLGLARFINGLMQNDRAFKFTFEELFIKYEEHLR